MARPIDAAMRRWSSFVELRASTRKTISPGFSKDIPCSRVILTHFGGIILEMLTRLYRLMPASLSAASKEARFSLSLPTPLVRKKYFGTRFTPRSLWLDLCKRHDFVCERRRCLFVYPH